MKLGKKLTIIGLIIFGIGVPSTATSMTMIGNIQSHGAQNGAYIEDITIEPGKSQNIKYTLRGWNPIIVSFYANPEGIPYSVIITNYERSFEVLNVLTSNSSEHRVEGVMPGTYDVDFTNLGDERVDLDMEIIDARLGKQTFDNRVFFQLLIYVYYVVFFGGIIMGIIGATVWKSGR